MSENEKQSVPQSGGGDGAQDGGAKNRSRGRRPRYNRNRDQKNRVPADASAAEMTQEASVPMAAVSAGGDSAPAEEGEDARRSAPRRSRNRRGGRGRGRGAAAAQESSMPEQEIPAEDAADVMYEVEDDGDGITERDKIASEVHELITEERLEAAAEAAEAADGFSGDAVCEGEAESKTPVEIVGVRFKAAGKVYYFDPDGALYREDDTVIVETARGIEFGFVVTPNRTVMASDIVSPLKKILRMATDEDRAHYEENNRREEAFAVCRDKIAEHGIEMKLVDVEYTFDNNKLLFYFTADGRVDFRELVKDLAAVFRTRIELRQIGIRDEAKLMGGLGVCGRPFCCHSFLSDFVQVSIKMAKEQNLSLNSAKISGTCGRLMCCLRYEYDVYEEEIRKTPKMDAVVETPDGEAVVCEVIPLAGLIRVKFLGSRSDMPPKLFHRDNVRVKGKMNWKSGSITYLDDAAQKPGGTQNT